MIVRWILILITLQDGAIKTVSFPTQAACEETKKSLQDDLTFVMAFNPIDMKCEPIKDKSP